VAVRVGTGEFSLSTILTILVVAPNEHLRRSIAFALEAEGFGVVSHPLLAGALASSPMMSHACIVVDEEAVAYPPSAWEELSRLSGPIVLLVDKLRTGPESAGMAVLHKPLLGRTLTETVFGVVAGNGAAT
jgi:hypothetical protein